MKLAFVVLHYNDILVTRECIKSLSKYLTDNQNKVDIIVVDNGSPKDKLYKNIFDDIIISNNIHLIISENNLGFAKGNNLGFKYAKNKLKSDVIILLNNDVVIYQEDFLQNIKKYVLDNNLDIAGPKIILNYSGENQNPIRREFYSKGDLIKRIVKTIVLYFLSYIKGADNMLSKQKSKLKYNSKKTTEIMKDDIKLHGACLIFANRYIYEQDGLFDKTFMYGEEDILRHIADIRKYNMDYVDEIVVYHEEGGSTEYSYFESAKKRRFRYKNALYSQFLLLKMWR